MTADGRTIPRHGYRLEDFVDDDVGGDGDDERSAEGFCTTKVQPCFTPKEVRESAAIYRLRRLNG